MFDLFVHVFLHGTPLRCIPEAVLEVHLRGFTRAQPPPCLITEPREDSLTALKSFTIFLHMLSSPHEMRLQNEVGDGPRVKGCSIGTRRTFVLCCGDIVL